jgi:glycosyltransferase involved in cell wall biosynthesis
MAFIGLFYLPNQLRPGIQFTTFTDGNGHLHETIRDNAGKLYVFKLKHTLDLVLPCYNPAEGWARSVISHIAALQQLLPDTILFIYLVNDGSTQGVKPEDIELLKNTFANFTYLRCPRNRGKGYALRLGAQASQHAFCIFTDIDFPYCPESLVQVYHALQKQKADIAVGVRKQAYYDDVPGIRTSISKLLRFFNKRILRLPVSDTQCGLKGFNQLGRQLFLSTKTDRYLFDLEFMLLASRSPGLQLVPVQVNLRQGIQFRKMGLGLLLAEGKSLLHILSR